MNLLTRVSSEVLQVGGDLLGENSRELKIGQLFAEFCSDVLNGTERDWFSYMD
jgi:hypothetical protein